MMTKHALDAELRDTSRTPIIERARDFPVNGTLNGIRLEGITALRTNRVGDVMHTTFRVLQTRLTELEQILHVDSQALFMLREQPIAEGRIVHYTADLHHGYEITIESHPPQRVDYDP